VDPKPNAFTEEERDQVRQTLVNLKQDQGKRQVAAFSPFPALSWRLWQYLAQHRAKPDTRLNWADLSKRVFLKTSLSPAAASPCLR
jgi:hypothetical protein